jgi:heat-inducible transcriptional repressor
MLEQKQMLCTVVSDKNRVVNKIIKIDREVNQEIIVRLNVALNTALAGLALEEINLGVISALTSQAGEFEELVNQVLKAITEAIATEAQMKIYTSGATNIFKYPELSDKDRASQLLTTLEEKSQLTELINEGDEETGIQVYIGSESPVQSMKDCSVVTATYELEDGFKGTIGIIGPKRMDYEKVVETLRTVKEQLSNSLDNEDS